MSKININRLRVVLAEQNRTNRWLAEQLGVNEGTVSHWTTNSKQPSVLTFHKIALILKVDIRDLFEPTLHKK
jgi:putative transcriptional regulator